jgi:RpiR family carbohydrate utilization transcriptional regulator
VNTHNFLDSLNAQHNKLRKSEQKVAVYVASNAQHVIHMRIVDVAQEAQVSEPTIVRFCRAVGCNGFQEFKLKLAQSLISQKNFFQVAVSNEDSAEEITQKVFDTSINHLVTIKNQLNPTQMANAIEAICDAKRIDFYGYGASGAVATDALHKFFRLQIGTAAYSDPHMQAMSAVTLSEGDVVVAISQSGRTSNLLHSVKTAQENGAKVISLSPANTPLAELSDLPLHINIEEDTDLYTPMSSRIVHLVIIDILAIAVAKARGPEFSEHLSKIQHSLKQLRTDN